MNNNDNDCDVLLLLVMADWDALLPMKDAFRAEGEMLCFKIRFDKLTLIMTRFLNAPGVDPYSPAAYEVIKKLFQPMHMWAWKIADLAAREEGIRILQQLGLITSGEFPPYRSQRTDCVRLWNQLRMIVSEMEVMVVYRNREANKLLNNLCSLQMSKISEEVPTEVCAVCIENFAEGDSVISLPCNHKYHAKCAISWLANNPTCPIDRRNAFEVVTSA